MKCLRFPGWGEEERAVVHAGAAGGWPLSCFRGCVIGRDYDMGWEEEEERKKECDELRRHVTGSCATDESYSPAGSTLRKR